MLKLSRIRVDLPIRKCIRQSRVKIRMDVLIERKRRYSRNKKDQRGDLVITDEKKGKKSSPRMRKFCASGTFQILNVR